MGIPMGLAVATKAVLVTIRSDFRISRPESKQSKQKEEHRAPPFWFYIFGSTFLVIIGNYQYSGKLENQA
ncbi:MAG: hypothetical protein HLUCCO16_14790 [Phormidium sp. OSCR]|nr:MAG: hypothetical protein HLUCCO16_14790 [Phormidium sp. OSCR]